jgi:hypothetical protein
VSRLASPHVDVIKLSPSMLASNLAVNESPLLSSHHPISSRLISIFKFSLFLLTYPDTLKHAITNKNLYDNADKMGGDPAQINRSLGTIRTELEFLVNSGLLSAPQHQSIQAQLPVCLPLSPIFLCLLFFSFLSSSLPFSYLSFSARNNAEKM